MLSLRTCSSGHAIRTASERALRWLAYTGLLVGLSGAGVATTASLLLGEPPDPWLALAAFCATMSSYTIDHLADRTREGHALRSATLARARGFRALGVGLFALAVAITVAAAGPSIGALLLAIPLAVALYALPWLGRIAPPLRRRGIRRVKDIPLIKAFYVTGFWALLAPFAAAFAGRPFDTAALPVALTIAVYLFINAVACDLRDVAADRAEGVVTFPALLGPERAVRWLRGLNALWAAGFLAAALAGFFPAATWPLALQSWAVDRGLRRSLDAPEGLAFYGDIGFDGILALQPLLLIPGALLAGR